MTTLVQNFDEWPATMALHGNRIKKYATDHHNLEIVDFLTCMSEGKRGEAEYNLFVKAKARRQVNFEDPDVRIGLDTAFSRGQLGQPGVWTLAINDALQQYNNNIGPHV